MGADAEKGPEKILIVGPAWIGDMVMAQSLFKLLRQDNPAVLIDVAAPAWSQALLMRMTEVRNTIPIPLGHGQLGLRKRFQIGRRLRAMGYDRAIVLPRSMKAALVPFFADIPLRTGFRGEMRYGLLNDVRKLDRTVLNQTVKRLIALGLPRRTILPEPPEPRLKIDKQNRSELLRRFDVQDSRAVVALMPGAAYGPAKCWPIEYFAEIAGQLTRAGVPVLVLGSAGEQPVGEEIRKHAGDSVRNLCGMTRLEDAVDILSATRAAVSNDSGLMHVAAAAGTHVVAIYGSSSPTFTPPLTNQKTIYCLDLECSPCFSRDCPLSHLRCLRDITPDQVLAGVMTVLQQA
ncbi:MAG: lipopolysaccharide heptosyltransferase II [Gammaproteobacteria bacterium]|nr:lipopolysaccharide heptosyltransferase II [Gammaproteobacteria bacterium]